MLRLQVYPPDAICAPCDDDTPASLTPIKFWSYEMWNVATPCINAGYAHTENVTLGQWRMRRVKDVSDDWYLAGRELRCSECQRHKAELQAELKEQKEDLEQVHTRSQYDYCSVSARAVSAHRK